MDLEPRDSDSDLWGISGKKQVIDYFLFLLLQSQARKVVKQNAVDR